MPMKTHERAAARETLEHAFDFAQRQVKQLLKKYPADYYPMYTVGGEFGHDRKRWTHWCDGFYPGLMFIVADSPGDEEWLPRAIA